MKGDRVVSLCSDAQGLQGTVTAIGGGKCSGIMAIRWDDGTESYEGTHAEGYAWTYTD